MKTIKIIGLICSLILIFEYIGVGITSFNIVESISLGFLQNKIYRLIISLGFIGFFYSIQSFLDKLNQLKTRPFIYSLIGLKIILLSFDITVYYFSVTIPIMIVNMLYIGMLILFIIAGIKILKTDLKIDMIRKLKNFVISKFTIYLVVLFLNLSITFIRTTEPITNTLNYLNIANSLYFIPYFFGLLFFIGLKEIPEVNKL